MVVRPQMRQVDKVKKVLKRVTERWSWADLDARDILGPRLGQNGFEV